MTFADLPVGARFRFVPEGDVFHKYSAEKAVQVSGIGHYRGVAVDPEEPVEVVEEKI